MGIKERREREKQLTREAILAAALEIARLEGWPALTIRKVGEHIEYSPPMVYEYFASKEDLLLHLIEEGFRQLTATIQRADVSTDDREERVGKIADAYWHFAIRNPELYQLMHGLAGFPLERTVITQAVQEVCRTTQGALLDWAQEREVVLFDAFGATEIVWSLLHGLVSLAIVNRIEGGEQHARDLMHHAIQSQLAGWEVSQKHR